MTTKKIGIQEIEKEYGVLTFGRLLKSYRLGEGFTQVEMAKKIGLSKQSLNDLENDRKIPSIHRAVQIAKKMDLLKDLVVQLVLQAQVNKENLNLQVRVTTDKKRAS